MDIDSLTAAKDQHEQQLEQEAQTLRTLKAQNEQVSSIWLALIGAAVVGVNLAYVSSSYYLASALPTSSSFVSFLLHSTACRSHQQAVHAPTHKLA